MKHEKRSNVHKILVGVVSGMGVFLGLTLNASAALTSLIDFSTLATDVTPLITTAVTAAASLGAMIIAAKLCWGFFKKFSRG